MQTRIELPDGALAEAIATYLERRLQFAFRNAEEAISEVVVRLEASGRLSACRMRIVRRHGRSLTVTVSDEDLYVAVNRCVAIAQAKLATAADRTPELERWQPCPNATD